MFTGAQTAGWGVMVQQQNTGEIEIEKCITCLGGSTQEARWEGQGRVQTESTTWGTWLYYSGVLYGSWAGAGLVNTNQKNSILVRLPQESYLRGTYRCW